VNEKCLAIKTCLILKSHGIDLVEEEKLKEAMINFHCSRCQKPIVIGSYDIESINCRVFKVSELCSSADAALLREIADWLDKNPEVHIVNIGVQSSVDGPENLRTEIYVYWEY
jgi:hypothetical protein